VIDQRAPFHPSLHAASFQLEEDLAAASQASSSKTTPEPSGSGTRNRSRPRFGFGGHAIVAAVGR
jgi:hypothetical protein